MGRISSWVAAGQGGKFARHLRGARRGSPRARRTGTGEGAQRDHVNVIVTKEWRQIRRASRSTAVGRSRRRRLALPQGRQAFDRMPGQRCLLGTRLRRAEAITGHCMASGATASRCGRTDEVSAAFSRWMTAKGIAATGTDGRASAQAMASRCRARARGAECRSGLVSIDLDRVVPMTSNADKGSGGGEADRSERSLDAAAKHFRSDFTRQRAGSRRHYRSIDMAASFMRRQRGNVVPSQTRVSGGRGGDSDVLPLR